MERSAMNHLKEPMVIAVVDLDANDHGPRHVERPLQYGCDLLRSADHKPRCPEGLRILDRVDGDRK